MQQDNHSRSGSFLGLAPCFRRQVVNIIIVIVVLLVLFGGGNYYTGWNYAPQSLIGLLVLLLVLRLLGVI